MIGQGKSLFYATLIATVSAGICARTSDAGEVGRISGVVESRKGLPISDVSIAIEALGVHTRTSMIGTFLFDTVPAGEHKLLVQRVGYVGLEENVVVGSDGEAMVRLSMEEKSLSLTPIVVTGTRTARSTDDSPVWCSVITKEEIASSGLTRLDDLLEEQVGVTVVSDHGFGVQMQGFDPDYTLILIDGDPVIGRTAGTLNLSRIELSNIDQVEIVKGPTSSLYGNEALAGVINLISREPVEPLRINLDSRIGTFGTIDIGAGFEIRAGKSATSVNLHRRRSAGYDLLPKTVSPTTPEFVDYTLSARHQYYVSPETNLGASVRIFYESQNSQSEVRENGEMRRLDNRAKQSDWSLTLNARKRIGPNLKLSGKVYSSSFARRTRLRNSDTDLLFSDSDYDQRYLKGESQLQILPGGAHILTFGIGAIREHVEANRIAGSSQSTRSGFLFAEEEWVPTDWLDLAISARADLHSEYANRVSPKAAVLIRPFEWLGLRGSLGGGFRAPDFKQIYLDFTNATAGYSVFGSTTVSEGIARLDKEGQIRAILKDPDNLEVIKAENSIAFNLGLEFVAGFYTTVKFNLFRNQVKDLIESAPVAIKTNGQSVFTYFNVSRVKTEGAEAELTIRPYHGIVLAAGYQFLQTRDEEVLEKLEEGQVVRNSFETRKLERVPVGDYGGLWNRSKHTGTIKLRFRSERTGTSGSLRASIRGSYGYRDRNLNGILDIPEEYLPGYTTWNTFASQDLTQGITLEAGIDNLFDNTQPETVPVLSGRRFYAGILKSF